MLVDNKMEISAMYIGNFNPKALLKSNFKNKNSLLKVRLQSPDATESVKQESYLPGRFKDIFAREGVRGLYRGAGPTTLRGALVAGAQG